MEIGTIGAGPFAQAFAKQALKAGHKVKLGNRRGLESLREIVDQLGPGAQAAIKEEAARFYWISVTRNRFVAISEWGTIPVTGRYATLKSITHPMLIVHGNKDIVVTPISAFILAERLGLLE